MSTQEGSSDKQTVSSRKVQANRQNALKSTGPRTPQGKAYSRRNALKHGLFARHFMEFLVLGENSHEYDQLLDDLLDQYQPIGRAEELEVERITLCWWRLRRVWRHENSLNHLAGSGELTEEAEYCKILDTEDDAVILQLQKITSEIETTHEVPQDLKQKMLAIWPKLEACWSLIENTVEKSLRNMSISKLFGKSNPDGQSFATALITVKAAISMVKLMRQVRTIQRFEITTAQHVIPDREGLDRILRYETAIERNLGRALDRLERLQRQRKGEPGPPSVNVRLTQ
jgi:hypothetical protein